MRAKTILFGMIGAIIFLIAGSVVAQEESNYIAQGDSAYEKFDNQTALEWYKKALAEDPRNFEAIWRISRAYVDIGEHLPEEKQLAYYEKALTFADSAIAVNPDRNEGYTRRAIALGRISLFKGVWKSIGLVKKVRKACEKAIELNPNDQIAIYVFARAHHKVAEKSKLFRMPLGLGWASKKKAKRLYEKAISLDSNAIMFHLDYAKLLIDTRKYDQAREELTKIQQLPITDEDDEAKKEEARNLLEEIKNK